MENVVLRSEPHGAVVLVIVLIKVLLKLEWGLPRFKATLNNFMALTTCQRPTSFYLSSFLESNIVCVCV